jgi:hypothetical protein
MAAMNLILIETLCTHYEVEVSFIDSLSDLGLIEVQTVEQIRYLPEENINTLEKMIRLHQELDVNPEGIDVIFNLLEKVDRLNRELAEARQKLRGMGLHDD